MQRKTGACNSGEEGHATKMIMGGNSIVVLWGRVYKTLLVLEIQNISCLVLPRSLKVQIQLIHAAPGKEGK